MRTESDYCWLEFRNCTGRATDAILATFKDYQSTNLTDPVYEAILKDDAHVGLAELKPLWDNEEFKVFYSYDLGLSYFEYDYTKPIA